MEGYGLTHNTYKIEELELYFKGDALPSKCLEEGESEAALLQSIF